EGHRHAERHRCQHQLITHVFLLFRPRVLGAWSSSRLVARRVLPDSQRYGACSMASSLFKSAWATPMSGTRTVTSISARTMARFICYPSLLSQFLGGRPRVGRCYAFLLNCFVARWGPLRADPRQWP